MSKPRVLYISSANPVKGPSAMALEHCIEMRKAGLQVDFMTHYPVESHPEIISVCRNSFLERFYRRIQSYRNHRIGLENREHFFFYTRESKPPVPISKVLRKINKEYDWVIIYFWQGLLSFATVDAIFEKLNHPVIFFLSPDFSHMTGGCHFMGDCQKYMTGCGKCPAIGSDREDDFTAWNVRYRQSFYEKVKPVVFGNTFMKGFYDRSLLLRNARVVVGAQPIDPDKFYPIENVTEVNGVSIPAGKSFRIAFGCQGLTDPRKGMDYLISAMNVWSDSLTAEEKRCVQLIVAGSMFDKIRDRLPFDAVELGLIPVSQLPFFYSSADIFVCPSVNDPGPSMVLQSIACGTPVVGFEMGAMLDYVKDQGTGYCAALKDISKLAEGMDHFFRMSKEQLQSISKHCRDQVLNHYTYPAVIRRWVDVYRRYSKEEE